jgi:hypothetical protein
MTDIEVLEDFFIVDEVAAALEWVIAPTLLGRSARELRALASNPDASPEDVVKAIELVLTAVGPRNMAAIVSHGVWDHWCPCHVDLDQFNNGHGAVIWTGNNGYVKCVIDDTDEDNLDLTLIAGNVPAK